MKAAVPNSANPAVSARVRSPDTLEVSAEAEEVGPAVAFAKVLQALRRTSLDCTLPLPAAVVPSSPAAMFGSIAVVPFLHSAPAGPIANSRSERRIGTLMAL